MRVIGGDFRGRRLRAPAGRATRPTSDRVREAVFDMLDTIVDLDGAAVADLFAGSGAMGIEALSRGAASAVFVERSPAAVAVIRANLAATGLVPPPPRPEAPAGPPARPTADAPDAPVVPRVRVVRGDAVGWLVGAPRFDLALVDPPYAFDDWGALLGRLDATVAVLESDREVVVPVTWEIARHKRYGDTLVTVVRHADVARPGQKGSP